MSTPEVQLVTLTPENLGKVQLFCGHSPTYKQGYKAKQEWLRARLDEGMRYILLQVRGYNAGMIEYIPGEYAWRGIEAPGYLVIHCLWVIGRNRGHGFGRLLLERCLEDAQGTSGVAVVSSKSHWLPTPKLFLKNGFELAESLPPFDLLVRRLDPAAPLPRFRYSSITPPAGLVLYTSRQCPYFQNAAFVAEKVAEQVKIPLSVTEIDSAAAAQGSPCPYGTLAYYLDGRLLTYHPLDSKKLLQLVEQNLAGDPG